MILNASIAGKKTDTDEWKVFPTKVEASGKP